MARCEYKLGHLQYARLYFQRVIELCNGQFVGNEIPYLLIAYDQASDIAFTLEAPHEAITSALDYYEFVIKNFQQITEAQYYFYMSRLQEKIHKHIAAANEDQLMRYQSLQSLKTKNEAERSFRLLVESHLLPEYSHLFSYMPEESPFRYFQASVNDKVMCIALKAYHDDVYDYGVKGLIINEAVIREALLAKIESINKQGHLALSLINPDTLSHEKDTGKPFISTAGF